MKLTIRAGGDVHRVFGTVTEARVRPEPYADHVEARFEGMPGWAWIFLGPAEDAILTDDEGRDVWVATCARGGRVTLAECPR